MAHVFRVGTPFLVMVISKQIILVFKCLFLFFLRFIRNRSVSLIFGFVLEWEKGILYRLFCFTIWWISLRFRIWIIRVMFMILSRSCRRCRCCMYLLFNRIRYNWIRNIIINCPKNYKELSKQGINKYFNWALLHWYLGFQVLLYNLSIRSA